MERVPSLPPLTLSALRGSDSPPADDDIVTRRSSGMYHKRESCGVTLTPPVESKAAFGTGGTCHRCHVSALFQHHRIT
ncbi:uncharacterized [Tachysurus ichikawai]